MIDEDTIEDDTSYGLDAEEEHVEVQSQDVRVKIRLGAAINGYKRGDELVVDRTHPLFGGLIDQGIAEVID